MQQGQIPPVEQRGVQLIIIQRPQQLNAGRLLCQITLPKISEQALQEFMGWCVHIFVFGHDRCLSLFIDAKSRRIKQEI